MVGSLGVFDKDGQFENRLFINNEFVPSVSGKMFDTVDPSTEKVITSVYEADAADVDLAVAAARAAFEYGSAWTSMFGSQRRDLILKFAQLIEDNKDYLAALESLDNGKPSANPSNYTSQSDVGGVIRFFRYFAGYADKIEGKSFSGDGNMLMYSQQVPVGVVGQIIPWNFPLLMLAWKVAPALATGCTIVLKTSEKTPLSALALCKLAKEAGFPPGVFNVLSGYGTTAGKALAVHMDVDKIAFTGSTPVGRLIEQYAAQSNMKRVSLELGGKSPLIVMPDADLDTAVSISQVGLFLNQGQACCASSRIYVHESIHDEFVKKCAAAAQARRLLAPSDPNCDQGPQVDNLQFDRVMSYIEAGKTEGAKLETGGARHGTVGYYIQPTVFSGVTDDMKICREEIFGPVMSILKFSDVEDVIKRANASMYGLAAGVICKDMKNALGVAHRLRAGVIWVNTYDFFDATLPFGGFKSSGHGREGGSYALELYTETRTICAAL